MTLLEYKVIHEYLDLILLTGIVLPLVMLLIVKQTVRQGRNRA